MKKFLPRTSKNPQGFTLIELLVVVTILAILGTIGVAVFSGAQKNARDGKSKADIDLIAKSIETSRTIDNTGAVTYTYTSTSVTNDFKTAPSGTNYKYCSKSDSTAVVADITWDDTGTPPTNPWTSAACPSGWGVIGVAAGDISSKKYWKVCAKLENSTSPYCKASLSQ